MGVLDTIRNFFSGNNKTKKLVSREAVEKALRRLARANRLKFRRGMVDSEDTPTHRSHGSRNKPRLADANDSIENARRRLKTLENVMENAKGDEEVSGTVLTEFSALMKDILGNMERRGVKKDRVVKLVEQAAPMLLRKSASREAQRPKSPSREAQRPKSPSFHSAKGKSPSFHSAKKMSASFHSAKEMSAMSLPIQEHIRMLMMKPDIPASLKQALAIWLQVEETDRTRAEEEVANAERAKTLREEAARVMALPRKATEVITKKATNFKRRVGDAWRGTRAKIGNLFGYKSSVPRDGHSPANVDVTVRVHLRDATEVGEPVHNYTVAMNTSKRVDDLFNELNAAHHAGVDMEAYIGSGDAKTYMKGHHMLYYYGIVDGSDIDVFIPNPQFREDF
jgi:hypothetical protein